MCEQVGLWSLCLILDSLSSVDLSCPTLMWQVFFFYLILFNFVATRVNDSNWNVSYTCHKGQISFLNRQKLGISTTSVQVSHPEVVDQHKRMPGLCVYVCVDDFILYFIWYYCLECFLFFPPVCSFILFSWFGWFCSCIGFYLFSG